MSSDLIIPGLVMGSAPTTRFVRKFDLWIPCAVESQPTDRVMREVRETLVLPAPMEDEWNVLPTGPQMVRALEVATEGARVLGIGGRVLVTCYAGRNRSGFVAALIVMLSCRVGSSEAVELVRRRRLGLSAGSALANPAFPAALRRFRLGR